MAKSVVRPALLFNRPGRPGRLGVSRTTFYDSYVFDPKKGGEQFIAGTTVPRLRLVSIGARISVAIDDEVDAIIEALRRERDRCLRTSAKRDAKTAAAEVRS